MLTSVQFLSINFVCACFVANCCTTDAQFYFSCSSSESNRCRLLYADRRGEIEEIMDYYGHFNRDGVNFPLNIFCLALNESTNGKGVAAVVRQWTRSMPSTRWANWLVSGNANKAAFISIMPSFICWSRPI